MRRIALLGLWFISAAVLVSSEGDERFVCFLTEYNSKGRQHLCTSVSIYIHTYIHITNMFVELLM